MTDRLARIGERLQACADDVRERPYSHPIACGWYAADVLALVNIAKAAQEASRLNRPTEAEMHALRAALSALDEERA